MAAKIEKKGIVRKVSNKIAISVITSVGWLIFVLYWVGFQWGGFPVTQNLIIILIALLVVGVINGVTWTRW